MIDLPREPPLAERMARLRAEHPDELVLPEPGPTGGHRLTLADVQPGDMVWSRLDSNDMRLDPDGEPRGGIVLTVGEKVTDDGEIIRCWRCFHPSAPWGRAFVTLTEHQVDPGMCETPDRFRLSNTVRRFCQRIAEQAGPIDPEEGDLIHAMGRLNARIQRPETAS